MARRTKLHLNHIEEYDAPNPFNGLTYVLRTDAHHSTALLKQNLTAHFNASAQDATGAQIRKSVHKAYRQWGHQVLKAVAEHLDYARYDLHTPQQRFLNVHFYNARALGRDAVEKGHALIRQTRPDHGDRPVFFISLDDMIHPQTPVRGSFAFSRLFDPASSTHSEYRARPGSQPLPEQLATLVAVARDFEAKNGYKLPVILLEDNVRHAKMVNTILGMMEESGLFRHAELGGISTCFCCADQAEREKIRLSDGKVVPVISVVDYNGAKIDVATPRDLLFDGYVVETPGDAQNATGRLPAIFMDAASLFKIDPAKAGAFNAKILRANLKFCETLERQFKTDLKLSWFSGAGAIRDYAGHPLDARMADVLRANDNAQKQKRRGFAP